MFLKENWNYSDISLWLWHSNLGKQTSATEIR